MVIPVRYATIVLQAGARAMVYRGHVENGMIRLDDAAPPLGEGIEVEVRILPEGASVDHNETVPSVYEALKDFVGKADGLPSDASVNLDHYLYGMPKRQ